jgi:hypothetical protein
MRYTKGMKIFVSATPAPRVDMQTVIDGYVCAGVFTLIALAQLFDYETLTATLETNGIANPSIIAAFSVVGLVFALPFLLRMYLSPLMRSVSLIAGWMIILLWSGIALFNTDVANTGLLGELIWLDSFMTLVLTGILLCLLTFVTTGSVKKLR